MTEDYNAKPKSDLDISKEILQKQLVCAVILLEMRICADISLGLWHPSIRSEGGSQEYKQGEKGQVQGEKEEDYEVVVLSSGNCAYHLLGECFGFVCSVHHALVETGVAS